MSSDNLELCSRLTRESLQSYLAVLGSLKVKTAAHLQFLASVVVAHGRTVKNNKSLVVRAICESPDVRSLCSPMFAERTALHCSCWVCLLVCMTQTSVKRSSACSTHARARRTTARVTKVSARAFSQC